MGKIDNIIKNRYSDEDDQLAPVKSSSTGQQGGSLKISQIIAGRYDDDDFYTAPQQRGTSNSFGVTAAAPVQSRATAPEIEGDYAHSPNNLTRRAVRYEDMANDLTARAERLRREAMGLNNTTSLDPVRRARIEREAADKTAQVDELARQAANKRRQAATARGIYNAYQSALNEEIYRSAKGPDFAAGETYTKENFPDYLERARALVNIDDWTDEQRAEAEQLYNVLKPRSLADGKSLSDWWSEQMYDITGDNAKYEQPTWRRVGVQGGDLYNDWHDVYDALTIRLQPKSNSPLVGFARGLGLLSAVEAGYGLSQKLYPDNEEAKRVEKNLAMTERQAQSAAPGLYNAGQMAGSLALMAGISGGVGAVPGVGSLPAMAKSAVTGAASMGGASAIQGIGSTVSGEKNVGEYLSDVGTSALSGAAGGALSSAVNSAGLKLLRGMNKAAKSGGIVSIGSDKIGAQNKLLPNVLLGGASSVGYAAGATGVQELQKAITDEEYSPDWKQIGSTALTAFAFGAISAFIQTAQTSKSNRAALEALNETLDEKYNTWKSTTDPAVKAQMAENTAKTAEEYLDALAEMQIVGADKQVRDIADFLWNIRQEMLGYSAVNADAGVGIGSGGAVVPAGAGALAAGKQNVPAVIQNQPVNQTPAQAAIAANGIVNGGQAFGDAIRAQIPGQVTENPAPAPAPEALPEVNENTAPEGAAEGIIYNGLINETPKAREDRLNNAKLTVTPAKEGSGQRFDMPALKKLSFSNAGKILVPILKKLGITGKGYYNAPLEVTFDYSNNGARRSIAHQYGETNGDYRNFAIVQDNLEGLSKNAYPLEMHLDEKPKATNNHVTQVATLASVLRTEAGDIPVKMTVKFYDNEGPKLHVVINGDAPVQDVWTQNAHSTTGEVSAEITIPEFFQLVNGNEDFGKRIPDGVKGWSSNGNGAPAGDLIDSPVNPGITERTDLANPEQNGGINYGGSEGPEPAASGAGAGGVVYGRGGERGDGERTGLEAGRLGESAGQRRIVAGAEQSTAANNRRRAAKDIRAEKINLRESGISRAAEGAENTVMPESIWDDEMRSIDERVFLETGQHVTFVLGPMRMSGKNGSFNAKGAYTSGGKFFVQADNLRASVTQIALHELFHASIAGDAALRATAKESVQEMFTPEEFDSVVAKYIAKMDGVITLSENPTEEEIKAVIERVEEEVLADAYAGINAFAAGADRFGDTVAEVVRERGGFRGRENEAATRETTGPPEKYSYAGKLALTADDEARYQAERLEMQGLSPEEIRQRTGWFRGADREWRYEIDDSGMKYRRQGDAAYMNDPKYREYLDLWDKAVVRLEASEEELARMRELDQKFKGVVPVAMYKLKNGGATLIDIIQHDELFRAYPQLRNTGVQFTDLPEGTRGEYDRSSNIIRLSNELRNAPEDTLIHEIQHAIQKTEGFASGASPEYWSNRIKNGYDTRTHEELRRAEALQRELDVMEASDPEFAREAEALYAATPDVPRAPFDPDTLEQIGEDPAEWQEFDAKRDAISEKYGEDKVFRFFDLKYDIEKSRVGQRSIYELYRNTAGEIEARDAAMRRSMTAEERKKNAPDLGGEDVVFAEKPGAKRDSENEPEWISLPELEKKVASDDVEAVQSIGRKSVNDFTSEDIEKSETFAKRYWREMGTKSPFFRAWFGDWRVNDQTPVDKVKVDKSKKYKAGKTVNKDTDKLISWGDTLKQETLTHLRSGGVALNVLSNIEELVKKAVLLDTEVSVPSSKRKMPGTSFMHSYYVLAEDGPDIALLKLYAEEAVAKNGEPFTRAYELKDIKKVAMTDKGVLSREGGLTQADIATIKNVSDLFKAVKAYDTDFNPKPASKIVDEDGRPLAVYHGTDADFTVFDRNKGRSTMDIQGSFFSPWEIDAGGYGSNIGKYYLSIKNPAPEGIAYKALNRFKGQNNAGVLAREYLESQGYDGVDNSGEEFIAFTPEQIKSATGNQGTFNRENDDVFFSLDEEDSDYLAAVERGDMDTAQRMVDEAAKAAGYGIKAYHGSRYLFNKFSREKRGMNTGTKASKQWFFAGDRDTANSYYPAGVITELMKQNPNMYSQSDIDRMEKRGIAGKLYSLYLKMDNPLEVDVAGYDYAAHREKADSFTEYIEQAEHDGRNGIILYHVRDNNLKPSAENSTVYMFSDPAQAKSADPVTYDDNGNVIPLSERFNPEKEDIRFSLDEVPETAEPAEKKKPKKPVAESRPIISKRELRSTLLDMFSIPEGRRAELGKIIDGAADRILKRGRLEQADIDAFFDRMYEEGVMTVPADDYFKAGRGLVAGERIFVPDRVRSDFGDDWNDFRRRAFAAGIYLTGDETQRGADSWNMELAESFPGLFDASSLDERDMLERIVQVAEEGKDEKMSLPEYAAMLTRQEGIPESEILDNLERQMDWALRTFAEKARLELTLRDRTGKKIAEEREKSGEALNREKLLETQRRAKDRERRLEAAQRQKERRELRELQNKTLKQLQWLSKNRDKAPAELLDTWNDVLGDLDVYAVGAANEMNWSEKYQATWRDIADMYKKAQENDPNFFPSKELQRIVDRLDKDKIGDMDIDALKDLYRAAVGLRTEYYNHNNVIGDEQRRLFSEVYDDVKDELESSRKSFTGRPLDKFVNKEQLTPMNFLERMAGWNKDSTWYSMARQLERGERETRDYRVKSERLLEDFINEHKDWVKTADGQGKNAVWYELEVPELLELKMGDKPIFGDTVKVYMTPAQKVHMYLESKSYDNLRHMAGGRTFADKDLYSEGKRQEAFAQGKTVKLAPETVKKIVSDLTPEEMELARALEKYYNDFAKGRINEKSNILYGYDKAMSQYYAPIYTNKNYVQNEVGVFDVTAEGVGNLKARQYSKNPSLNLSAFDAFEKHADQTARFVGMAIPTQNWQTLMNWRVRNNSMGDVITHKWGDEAKKYIEDLLTELQGGKTGNKSSIEKLTDTALSNYVSAVFGANPGIVFKQAASFPQLASALGWENAPKPGQLLKVDEDLINAYTSELAYRTLGYATPETAQLKNNPSVLDTNKVTKFLLRGGAIVAMDAGTVKRAWPWAENKVRREHPELEIGTEEQIRAGQSPFYKKVAEEFENAISLTQPMYDTMHRANIMRNSGGLTRAFTMFKTVPLQQYNSLRRAFGELSYAKSRLNEGNEDAQSEARKEYKSAAKKAGAAVTATLASVLMLEAVEFLNQLLKNGAKKYRDDEEELTAASVAEKIARNSAGDLAGMLIGGDEVTDILANIFLGEKWYGIEIPGGEQLNDLIDSMTGAAKTIKDIVAGAAEVVENGGDLGAYFKRHSGDYAGAAKDLAEKLAMYFKGLPVQNIEKYIMGITQHISPELYAGMEDVFDTPTKTDLKDMEGPALNARIGNVLAVRNVDASEDTVEELTRLYESGQTGVIPTDTPKSFTIDGEERKLNEYQRQTYDRVWSGTVGRSLDNLIDSEAFKAADSETQAKMIQRLYKYGVDNAKETLFDDYEAEAATRHIRAIMASGLDFSDAAEIYAEYDRLNDNKELSKSQKATDFLKWIDEQGFNDTQKETIREELGFWSMVPAGAETYDKMTGAGLSVEDAYKVTNDLRALTPEEGKSQVSNLQKYRTIASEDMSEKDKVEAIGTIMGTSLETESGNLTVYAKMLETLDAGVSLDQYLDLYEADSVDGYLKYLTADKGHNYGITTDIYIKFKQGLPDYDADGSGSFKQAEVEAAIEGIFGSSAGLSLPSLTSNGNTALTNVQKAVLWQLQTRGKNGKSNPYSKEIGAQVEASLEKKDSKEETLQEAIARMTQGR